MNKVAVIGTGMTDVGIFEDSTWLELAVEAAREAILDSGVPKSEIEALVTTPVGYAVNTRQTFVAQRLAEYLQIPTKVLCEVDCGGSSSLLAVRHLENEIASGRVDVGLVCASHLELTVRQMYSRARETSHLVRLANAIYGSYDSRFGLGSPMAHYAMCTQRYKEECGITDEQVAELPVVLRENASRNPRAMYREPITVDDVLSSKMLCPPIRLLESCPLSHGAGALILATEQKAREVCDCPVFLTGYGESHDASHFLPSVGELSRFPSVERAAREAYNKAGIEPGDMDVAEVYGAFAGTELMCYEELGFFGRGEAPAAVAAGRTKITGDMPVNTSGGRLSLGHAAYATPLFEVFEIVSQLKGDAGERQVEGAKAGLVHAEHGMVNGSAVYILEAS